MLFLPGKISSKKRRAILNQIKSFLHPFMERPRKLFFAVLLASLRCLLVSFALLLVSFAVLLASSRCLLVSFALLLVNSHCTLSFALLLASYFSHAKKDLIWSFFVYSFMLAIIGAGELHAFPLNMRAIFFTKGLEAIAFIFFFFCSIHRVHPS